LILCLFLVLSLSACNSGTKEPEVPYSHEEDVSVPDVPPEKVPEPPIEHEEIVFESGKDPEENPYTRIKLQPVPKDAELRDSVYVYRPYFVGEFFNEVELFGLSDETPPPTNDYYGFGEDFWGGCSIWCGAADKWEATASSTLTKTGSIFYSAMNLRSNTRLDAWCEGTSGYGIGEYIDITYTLGNYDEVYGGGEISKDPFSFTSLCIVNGYAKDEALWRKNARVKTLKLYVNNELKGYIELTDTIKPQYFPLYDLAGACGVSTLFRFEIADVYKGSAYEDTCLTGIVFGFSGPFGH